MPVIVELHGDWRTFARLYGSPARRRLARLADAIGGLAFSGRPRCAPSRRTRRSWLEPPVASRMPQFPAFMDLEPFTAPVRPLPDAAGHSLRRRAGAVQERRRAGRGVALARDRSRRRRCRSSATAPVPTWPRALSPRDGSPGTAVSTRTRSSRARRGQPARPAFAVGGDGARRDRGATARPAGPRQRRRRYPGSRARRCRRHARLARATRRSPPRSSSCSATVSGCSARRRGPCGRRGLARLARRVRGECAGARRAVKLVVITQRVDPDDPALGATVPMLRALAARVDELAVLDLVSRPTDLPANVRVHAIAAPTQVLRGARLTAALARSFVPGRRRCSRICRRSMPCSALRSRGPWRARPALVHPLAALAPPRACRAPVDEGAECRPDELPARLAKVVAVGHGSTSTPSCRPSEPTTESCACWRSDARRPRRASRRSSKQWGCSARDARVARAARPVADSGGGRGAAVTRAVRRCSGSRRPGDDRGAGSPRSGRAGICRRRRARQQHAGRRARQGRVRGRRGGAADARRERWVRLARRRIEPSLRFAQDDPESLAARTACARSTAGAERRHAIGLELRERVARDHSTEHWADAVLAAIP